MYYGEKLAAKAPTIVVDKDRKVLVINGRPLFLTRSEFGVTAYLSDHPHHVKSRAQILDHVYGNAGMTDRSIDSLVKRVRLKVRLNGADPIKTRHGFGYYWDADQVPEINCTGRAIAPY